MGVKLSKIDGDPLIDPFKYRHVIGALHYCTLARSEIAFSVYQLCQNLHAPTSTHLGRVEHGLFYTKGNLQLTAFCDFDWAGNRDDRCSSSGHTIFLGPCLVSWSAKKLAIVARFSTEAKC
jgi:hypothetical protein